MSDICVLGAGSWGTALANLLAGNGHNIKLWDHITEIVDNIAAERENKRYLPDIKLSDSITPVPDMSVALRDADAVVFAVPAQYFGDSFKRALPYLDYGKPIVNVAKGIELKSLRTLSEVAFSIFASSEQAQSDTAVAAAGLKYAVLSGPSHAEEVARRLPTTVVCASSCPDTAESVRNLFMNDYFRIYTGDDVIGLELGGAMKNIIALGAGISDGMGYGDNTKAALMTRGLAEMTRLGVKIGADPGTFAGLGGIGDLIVTCTSMHSRNRRCGILIGEGVSPPAAVEQVGMVVEGIHTAEAVHDLAAKLGVDVPITDSIYRIIKGEASPDDALRALMTRDKKEEREQLT